MSSYGPKSDVNASGWEESEFPILCDKCLGPNPYLRMQKREFGKECKICVRPFTVFSWCPGAGSRYKKTEICNTCAKMKHCCQSCILDLTYGIPVHLRDVALGIQNKAPTQSLNRQYFAQNMEDDLKGNTTMVSGSLGREENGGKQIARELARSEPYYKPTKQDNQSSQQTQQQQPQSQVIENVTKEVPRKRVAKLDLTPPEDTEVVSLYCSALPQGTKEEELKISFPETSAPSIKSITLVPTSKVAFVNFASRNAAELAAQSIKVQGGLFVNNESVNVKWGRSKKKN